MLRRFWLWLRSWLFSDVLKELERTKSIARTAQKLAETIERRTKAIAALDVGMMRDSGWLILLVRVNGQDRVMLQQIVPNTTLEEYRRICIQLADTIGAEFRFVDSPGGAFEAFLDRDVKRRARRA